MFTIAHGAGLELRGASLEIILEQPGFCVEQSAPGTVRSLGRVACQFQTSRNRACAPFISC